MYHHDTVRISVGLAAVMLISHTSKASSCNKCKTYWNVAD